jgi:DNA-binding NtrC family response regulator
MVAQCILIGCKTKSIVPLIKEVAVELAINFRTKHKVEDFLLDIQENDYNSIIFEMNMSCYESLKTIRLIRRMRPKIPLIVLMDKIDKKIGGQLLSEGVFHLLLSPPSRENLQTTLSTALKSYKK